MSTYKLKKHIKTKKINHFKIPFFGHQLLPQWDTTAYSKTLLEEKNTLLKFEIHSPFCTRKLKEETGKERLKIFAS